MIEYDANDDAPELTFKQDGEDALVFANGEIIARVDNAGSVLTSESVELSPVRYA